MGAPLALAAGGGAGPGPEGGSLKRRRLSRAYVLAVLSLQAAALLLLLAIIARCVGLIH